ncbi:ATP synthase F1 subunit delta [Phycisphaeraceae bacterium D3-23]
MARKGFWNKLFGGDEPPEDRPKETPPRPEPQAEPDPPAQPEPSDPPAGQDGTPQDPAEEIEDDRDLIDIDTETDTDAVSTPPQTPEVTDTPEAPADPDPVPGDVPLPQTAELKTDAVGRVYAGALLDLAREAGEQDAVAQEVGELLPLVESGSDLHRLLTNPVISADERSKIIGRVFEGKVSDLLLRFLKVVADKDRLGSLGPILSGYLLAIAESGGKVTVDAYVAAAMDDATASRVAERIGQSLGKEVALRQHVDESLIGGLKIKVGDKLIDASVASQLRAMKNKMIAGKQQ